MPMGDLTDTISEVLQDPARLQQFMDMAASIKLPFPTAEESQPPSAAKTGVGYGKKQQTLINALLPYLQPTRQTKLRRAMELSRMTQVAAEALQRVNIGTAGTGEEDAHV